MSNLANHKISETKSAEITFVSAGGCYAPGLYPTVDLMLYSACRRYCYGGAVVSQKADRRFDVYVRYNRGERVCIDASERRSIRALAIAALRAESDEEHKRAEIDARA